MAPDTVHVNLKGLFFAMLVVIALIIVGLGTVGNGDPLWFLPRFDQVPEHMIVYRNGCRTELWQGSAGFDDLTHALQRALPQVDGMNSSYGISLDSLDDYRQKERALEVVFDKPVTIHTLYKFGHPDTLFIPLSSYFADSRSVFGGTEGQYWAGALRIKSLAELQQLVDALRCP